MPTKSRDKDFVVVNLADIQTDNPFSDFMSASLRQHYYEYQN